MKYRSSLNLEVIRKLFTELWPFFDFGLMLGCGNSKIYYFCRGKQKAKMYLSIENFTCPKEQISLYLTTCLNNLFFQKQYETRCISSLSLL